MKDRSATEITDGKITKKNGDTMPSLQIDILQTDPENATPFSWSAGDLSGLSVTI